MRGAGSFIPRHLPMEGVDPGNFSLNLSRWRVVCAPPPPRADSLNIVDARRVACCTCIGARTTDRSRMYASAYVRVGNVHTVLAGARRPSSPVPPVCALEFPRAETFSSQQQSSRLAELLPNDVPDRYFVSRINKAATLRDLLALPSVFHRLYKQALLSRRCPDNLPFYLSSRSLIDASPVGARGISEQGARVR